MREVVHILRTLQTKNQNKTWYEKSRVGAQDVTFAAGLPYPLLLGLCLPLLHIKDLH